MFHNLLAVTLASIYTSDSINSDLTECALQALPETNPHNVLILNNNRNDLGSFIASEISRKLMEDGKEVYSCDPKADIRYSKYPFINPAQFIIWILETINSVDDIVHVRYNMLWSSKAPLLIIMLTKGITEEEVMALIWKEARASKVVIMTTDLTFYAWQPYKENECNVNITKFEIAECTGNELKQKRPQIFPSRIESYNNCPIYYVTYSVYPYVGQDPTTGKYDKGIEIAIVNTFTEKYGGELQYVEMGNNETFYMSDSNETFYGAARLLSTYKVDLAFGSMFQSSQHSGYADLLQLPHSNDQLVWFVPQPEELGAIHNMYRAFKKDVWPLVLAACILVSLTTYTLQGGYPNFSHHALQALSISLSYPVNHPKTFALKLFVMIAYLYSINVVTAYQAALTSFLTKPLMESEITSVQDAINKDLTAYMYSPHRPYIEQPEFPDTQLILSNRHVFRKEMKFETMSTLRNKFVLGVRSTTLFYLIWKKKVDKRGKLVVRTIEPGVLSFHVTILTSKGNLIKTNLDITVKQIIESGIKIKWHRDLIDSNVIRMPPANRVHGTPLTVGNIAGALWVLTMGLVCALIGFLTELLFSRFF